MKNGLLGILAKLSRKKDAVTWTSLNRDLTGFKALPNNGKRAKLNETPILGEVSFVCDFKDAQGLYRERDEDKIAFVIWVNRGDFIKAQQAAIAEKEKGKEQPKQ